MITLINVLHAIANRRLWFNITLAVITFGGYAAEIGLHAAGMHNHWSHFAFILVHALSVTTWIAYQPKRRTARHRNAAA